MRHGQRPPADTSRDSGAVEEEEEEEQPRAASPPPPPPPALGTGHRLGIQNPPAGPTSVCVCVCISLSTGSSSRFLADTASRFSGARL